MGETYNKKEKEKKKQQKRKEKLMRKEERKENAPGGGLDNMLAYVDEFGVIQDTAPDPSRKMIIDSDEIEIGIPKREKEAFDPAITGVISFFDNSKGYGFIKSEDGTNFFVHTNNVSGVAAEGKHVRFEKEKGPKGWTAVKVVVQ